ncbi:16S rRNA G966 N2-methylase RsmD [Dysgonomonadaceae bacterium PH5-43]|nr:16S rRNA G966 N2-methylase RsmD [Dysgonomonadaceae bacterium PH5-43]
MLNQATKKFISEHLNSDIRDIALRIKPTDNTDIDIPFALNQIASKKKAKHKLPTWFANDNIVYPPILSLEQCSSEVTAKYKAALLKGNTFVDLTGGFGIDTAWISRNFVKTYYIEQQEHLTRIANHNFETLNLNNIEVINTNAIDYLETISYVDCIFIDPARRSSSGSKVFLIQDCEPDIITLQDKLINKANKVLIKLSPMLDVKSAIKEIKHIEQVHIISVDNECKELLLLLDKDFTGEPQIICVNIDNNSQSNNIFLYEEEYNTQTVYASSIKRYLYEPNVSILKGGFYKSISNKYEIEKLHINSHLYTSDELKDNFPGRAFEVIETSTMNKKELKTFLKGVNKANITVRNFPISVDDLRKKIKVKDGGELYLFATTISEDTHILIKTRKAFSQK